MASPIIISQLRSPTHVENYGSPRTHSQSSDTNNPKICNTTINTTDKPTAGEMIAKYKCYISSERLTQLRKMVDEAIKEHRIFTIRGGWQTLRRAFLRRNWIEKLEVNSKVKSHMSNSSSSLDDLCQNLPMKQSWESQSAHIMKCERTIMSRLLQVHDVDFYWNTRKDNHDVQFRLSCNKLMSRFSRSLFTSKEGLCLLLQQMYWHNEPGVANVNFPRCYVLGFPDHYNNFVDDFRLTACSSLLKHIVHLYETQDQYAIQSPEGLVPYSAFQFAMDRLNEFLASKKHMDIDVDIPTVEPTEWTHFLDHFEMIVHEKHLFLENKNYVLAVLVAAGRAIVKKLQPYWPQMNLDGMKNIWIMKPGNKCRGRGIQLIKDVKDVARIMELKLKYVVQKYIEKPLIIYNTKFDIRQWFLVTSVQPLIIWMYRESYLRFSSQNFSLENFHESLHLTNHAVQCKYKNTQDRDKALPEDNMWDCYTFQTYLKNMGQGSKWESVIFPGMKESIIGSMLSCQDTMDRRPNTFELYGADFILAEDFKPWLLEINSSPDLSASTSVTARMCPQCLEDLVKVVIDKRRDTNCDTGYFDLIYKQNFPRPPAYLGMSLSVRGRRIFKRHKNRKDKENDSGMKKNTSIAVNKNARLSAPEKGPRIVETSSDEGANRYKGPVIADLMEEIQRRSFDSDPNDGIEVAQPIKLVFPKKRVKASDKVANVSTHRTSARSNNHLVRKSSPRNSTRNANFRIPRTAPQVFQPQQRPQLQQQLAPAYTRKNVSRVSEWRSLGRDTEIACAASTDTIQTPNIVNESVVSIVRAKRTHIAKFNKNYHINEILHKSKQQQQVFLEQLQELQVKQQQHHQNVKDFTAAIDKNKLLTVGKSLGRLMRPHT